MTNSTPDPAVNSRAGRREWTATVVLLLPLLLVSMDVSVLFFAVPEISRALDVSSTQQLWIFDVYGFALAGLLITMGSVGDRIGRRKLLMLGALAFGTASVGAAYAQSAEMLIAARALLGVGGATLMPSTMALVRNMFRDDKQRSTAIGLFSGVMAGGIALGSVMSGFLLGHFWWGSVFLVNVPAMVMLLVLAPVLVPEFKDPAPGRFDWVSVPLSMAAVLPLIYGLKEFAADGYSTASAGSLAAGLVFGALFTVRQRRRTDAMISRELFRGKGFGAAMSLTTLATFAMMGSAFFTTQYLQSVRGMGPLEAALWSLLPSVAVGFAAPASTALGQRVNRAYVITGGFVTGAAGYGILTFTGTDSLWLVLIGAAVLACGIVAVIALVNDLALAVAPAEKAGSAAALMETGHEFGGALGMAVLGSIGTAVYRSDVESGAPAGIPAEAMDGIRETLGGATQIAAGLPHGEAVLTVAREAFVHGMQWAAAGGAAVLLIGAVVAVVTLRRLRVAAPEVDLKAEVERRAELSAAA
ncbi:Antiseptic resistance protein [Streptomyces sp. RB5]|uniref:Antiseptic resistance protein n=1 Tax=Streptomyces smaragdinus TaxID=2585196 RepID=A0A7K0CFJ4_9ACTN|nr:MFS transporter [Streptomyces smaragdinus]MQY12166.1 Antiseptic resistance protein [Streptomyces smaragdinus]